MPKRIRKKRSDDPSMWAYQIVKESVQDEPPIPAKEISKVMAEMGRKGGKIGGKRRLETMTKEERSDAASHAARKRWSKANRNGKR
jgi:hypothetical protein